MPARRRYAKRRATRRYRRRGRKVAVPRNRFMLGRTYKTNLRYESIQNITAGVDPGTNYLFSANDLYDPDVTSGGHQPRGFDQLMTFYDHFNVIGSRITIRFLNADSVIQGVLCTIRLRDDSTPATSITTVREDPGVRQTILGHAQSGRNMGVLRKGFSAKKFFGKPPMSADNQQGTAFGSPSEQAYYHINVSAQSTGTAGAIEAYVTIDYTAIFTEPKMPAAS